jgi:hypothetical protein
VRDGKLHVYWCYPGKDITDGLVPVECDADCVEMIKASSTVKTLALFVDHTNFLRNIRADVILNGAPNFPLVISPSKLPRRFDTTAGPSSSSDVSFADKGKSPEFVPDEVQPDDSNSEQDSDFYDSDYNVEEGDDDLFAENIDTSLNDNNEKEFCYERENEVALDDEDLNLGNEERQNLKNKFKPFDPEIDMANPTFRAGMTFSGVEELRKALAAYSIRNRVPIRKVKNDKTRLNDVCSDGCPWMLKASADTRQGGFCITAYSAKHDCEGVWPLEALTAKILQETFIHEFRDNQKLGLQSFAAKVQREFNMCPTRFKLSRARKAALLQIHGDEIGQFNQLLDYGQELRRSNPGSKFFLTTNSVNDPRSADHREHLATVYWSYDACKRGFLAGCRPLICLDGCHIKTRYKGVLLTAVGIDPNDCIFPVAFGLVEVECTSSWEWFLQNLKDDLNITNTSPWTLMSDKQKVISHSFCDAQIANFISQIHHCNCVFIFELYMVS